MCSSFCSAGRGPTIKSLGTPLSATPIALISGPLAFGGAEQQLVHVLSHVDRAHWAPLVIEIGDGRPAYSRKVIQGLDVPLVYLDGRGNRIRRVAQVVRALREHHATIVHAWLPYLNPYAALAGRWAGVPFRCGSVREDLKGLRPLDPRWLRFCALDLIVANWSGAVAQIQQSWYPAARVRVVRNGVRVEVDREGVERRRARQVLGLGSSDLVVGAVGRCDANKNFDLLLQVCARLASAHDRLKVVIIGDGPLHHDLSAAVGRLGLADRVRLPGWIEMAAGLMAAFDVCCLTSWHEGMPNVVMEAASAGVPVVASACGGTAEVVDDGETGYLVPPGDLHAMTARVDVLLGDEARRRKFGAAGQAKMRRDFSIGSMTSQLVAEYAEMIRAR